MVALKTGGRGEYIDVQRCGLGPCEDNFLVVRVVETLLITTRVRCL